MSSGRSFYQRRPERYAREKENFQRLIEKLKRVAFERGYTKNQIALEHVSPIEWDNIIL